MINFLLDTNIVIHAMKGRPQVLADKFNHYTGRMAISAITVGELHFGVQKSKDVAKSGRVLEDFISHLEVLPFDEAAAWHYGEIRFETRSQPIGHNDMLIAAHARSEGLVLVTNNTKEFERVDGLRLQNWV